MKTLNQKEFEQQNVFGLGAANDAYALICTLAATYADERVLTEDGKLNYHILKPVLFEMPTYEYLRTGETIGKCMSFGRP